MWDSTVHRGANSAWGAPGPAPAAAPAPGPGMICKQRPVDVAQDSFDWCPAHSWPTFAQFWVAWLASAAVAVALLLTWLIAGHNGCLSPPCQPVTTPYSSFYPSCFRCMSVCVWLVFTPAVVSLYARSFVCVFVCRALVHATIQRYIHMYIHCRCLASRFPQRLPLKLPFQLCAPWNFFCWTCPRIFPQVHFVKRPSEHPTTKLLG